MKPMTVCNWVGTGLITAAAVIHIVCVVTNYHSVADFSNIKDDMKGKNLTAEEIKMLLKIADAGITSNYGLWHICAWAKEFPGGTGGTCKTWNEYGDVKPWLHGAQALGITGALVMVAGVVVSVINLIVDSRGGIRRRLPFIVICSLCIFGGLITFGGDLLMVFNYHTVDGITQHEELVPPEVKAILEDQFSLSWGFGLDIGAAIVACIGGVLHVFSCCLSDKARPVY